MNDRTFESFVDQLMRFYHRGAYAQALDLLEQEASHFPERARDIYYWRMSMASRLYNLPLALRFFAELLEQGHWLPPRWLRDDEALKPLQGLPKFEEMVAVCKQKFAELQENARPELLIMHPDGAILTSAQPRSLLMALHGNAGNINGTLGPWSQAVEQGWLLVLPQSSQVSGENAYAWEDWEKASREIYEHYVSLTHRYAIGDSVIIGGFSVGGGLAVWLALSGMLHAHGFVALGPYLPDVAMLVPLLEEARANDIRGYIIVGQNDTASLRISRQVNELLNDHGIPCMLELCPGLGHTYPPDFAQILTHALEFVTQ